MTCRVQLILLLCCELLITVIETKNVFDESTILKDHSHSFHSNMTTISQKKKALTAVASGEFEAMTSENNLVENLVAGSSK